MEKETAVEFLVKQYCIYGTLYSSDISQAKEMEKQQIIDAYKSGRTDVINKNNINPIQYYNETFKNK